MTILTSAQIFGILYRRTSWFCSGLHGPHTTKTELRLHFAWYKSNQSQVASLKKILLSIAVACYQGIYEPKLKVKQGKFFLYEGHMVYTIFSLGFHGLIIWLQLIPFICTGTRLPRPGKFLEQASFKFQCRDSLATWILWVSLTWGGTLFWKTPQTPSFLTLRMWNQRNLSYILVDLLAKNTDKRCWCSI